MNNISLQDIPDGGYPDEFGGEYDQLTVPYNIPEHPADNAPYSTALNLAHGQLNELSDHSYSEMQRNMGDGEEQPDNTQHSYFDDFNNLTSESFNDMLDAPFPSSTFVQA